MANEIIGATNSMLAKYLTAQSGYMAMILLVLIPFVKTMLSSDFTSCVPIENLIFTVVILGILVIANFKDKAQEHAIAVSALTNPKLVEQNINAMKAIAEANRAAYTAAIEKLNPKDNVVFVQPIDATNDTTNVT